MLPIRNNMVWNLEAKNHESTTWADIQNNMNFTNNGEGGEEEEEEAMEGKEEFELGSLSGLNSFLGVEDDDSWILTTTDADVVNNDNNGGVNTMQGNQHMGGLTFSTNFNETLDQNLILHSLDSSAASCSPSPASVYSNIDALSQVQSNYFLQPLPKNSTIPGFNALSSSEFNFNSFNMGCESVLQNSNGLGVFGTRGFSDLNSQTQMGTPYLSSGSQFSTAHLLQRTQNTGNSLFFNNNGNRSHLLQPLDNNVASIGPQPTLFQKRAAQRMNLTGNVANFGALGVQIGHNSMKEIGIKNNSINGDQFEAVKIDGSNLDYDSDELTETTKITEENGIMTGGNRSNANKEVTGEDNNKGKKKGPPAKNLMAERRRREKLNDRLKMLRSVVPKISKMDRASILGDAIEYLKELRHKINNLQTELESTPLPPLPPSSSSSFYPLTPTSSALPVRVKDELCPTPTFAGKPANIEVRTREGRGVNIHMFCGRRPGLLLSTMTALDSLGLDIQQAVISCFNGFALDIFRAEQCKEGQDIPAEHIRAILLDSAGFREMV